MSLKQNIEMKENLKKTGVAKVIRDEDYKKWLELGKKLNVKYNCHCECEKKKVSLSDLDANNLVSIILAVGVSLSIVISATGLLFV